MKNPTTVENVASPDPSGGIDTATLELLAKWRAEDATTDTAVIQAVELELSDFKKAMNANRLQSGERPLFS